MVTVSIIGGTGYTGSELLRILSNHPEVEIEYVTSRKEDGKKVTDLHTHLRGLGNLDELEFKNISPEQIDSDIVFCATPHGASMKIVPQLYEKGLKVIDLSGDYRFENMETYEEWYKLKHTGKLDAVYGLPELHRNEIKKAKVVANPGCFPTGAILALAPLAKEGLIEERVIIDSKTGVSGAGVEASQTTHFPNVNENINPYKITTHRHTPEIEKELNKLSTDGLKVSFTPHLAPLTRGILTTAHTFLKDDSIKRDEIIDLYKTFYKNEPFVRVFESGMVSLTGVRGSNFCDIGGFEIDRYGRLVVVSAIDNLVKGASGQAIQNMNIIAGFDEKEGLFTGSLRP
ncbi:MAG: N-acetyl-gamma-glutamyl-phosphate reductase [Methanothermococcus sp.]|jgi:N-acetyl-gamma-glutamyl-phosphate reductase|uniref:N-acetyl-gamma-glutamyl-phosphate reductase n=1 Tax=Methanothermococcus TaxID=155862 RepID=UPI00037426A4|nr:MULTISPECIES: N-acetyl-gamma-glutamyl-phosphate reductase [Methanothermococcus]MDK2790757.1 N-acetyl-gamma-glutamyl-phosphate reductase [Methanothermococcus sp.]MDK2987886.1 N-acetyl-gamma-glutamyl-phosphate reductase [Methanothermococcus sp.]